MSSNRLIQCFSLTSMVSQGTLLGIKFEESHKQWTKTMDAEHFVFDVSNVFWAFIRALINEDKHLLTYSPDFVCFFVAAQQYNKMSVRKNVIWINDDDIDILNYPLNADTYYHGDCEIYVFDTIEQLVQHVETIFAFLHLFCFDVVYKVKNDISTLSHKYTSTGKCKNDIEGRSQRKNETPRCFETYP